MKALVVLSGGQDSTTCLAAAIRMHGVENVFAVTFDYGQRHRVELLAAKTIAKMAGIESRHEVIEVPNILKGDSPLVSGNAVEQYKDASVLPGGLEKTFVPMRNQFFLTIAANRAIVIAKGDKEVHLITGVSQEDYGGYPDCRQEFIWALQSAIRLSNDDPALPALTIVTPLMYMSKKETVAWSEVMEATSVTAGAHGGLNPSARELLAYSHTCYNGEVPPCGKCHACLLRAKGYKEAGVIDPLVERLFYCSSTTAG